MSGRKAHILNQTKSVARPSDIIFFDTETSQVLTQGGDTLHRLKIGVAQHYRSRDRDTLKYQAELVFQDKAQFWRKVDRAVRDKSTVYLVAHNIVFDLAVMDAFSWLASMGWELSSFYTKAAVSIFRWKQGERQLVGIDNCNLFPGKLETWGKIMDLPKLPVDFESVSLADLVVYCRRDVEIMVKCWRTWLAFLDLHDCGEFKPTVASTALNTWRHRFMPGKVHIHADPLALRLERESYKGGRVEVLYKGRSDQGPFYYLDINNMYGYVLSRYMYPAGLYDAIETDSVSYLVRKLSEYAVVACVDLETDDNPYPYKVNDFTAYPVGSFTTVLTTPELILACQRGWLRGVHALAWYRQAPLFARYVKYFHGLRLEYRRQGNGGYAAICKLLVNSLYGKFGQQGIRQEVIGECAVSDIWSQSVLNIENGQYTRMTALGGKVFEEYKEGESFHSFPAIAAHVTAYARLYLYNLVRRVPDKHVFYLDTDSLVVDETGYQALKHLVDPDTLGLLKVEHSSPWLEINSPKDYRMQDRTRLKGISPAAVQLDQDTYSQTQWMRLAGMVRAGSLDGYRTRQIIKRQRRLVHSGYRLADGWVSPFVLAEGELVGYAVPEILPSEPLLPYEWS